MNSPSSNAGFGLMFSGLDMSIDTWIIIVDVFVNPGSLYIGTEDGGGEVDDDDEEAERCLS